MNLARAPVEDAGKELSSARRFLRLGNPSQLTPLIVFIKVLSMLLHGSQALQPFSRSHSLNTHASLAPCPFPPSSLPLAFFHTLSFRLASSTFSTVLSVAEILSRFCLPSLSPLSIPPPFTLLPPLSRREGF